MPSYAIGSYDFHSLSLKPRRSTLHSEIEVRPGKNGHAFFMTGTFGDPFEIVSVVDLTVSPTTVAHAYETLISTLQTLTYGGAVETNYYQVLDVRIQREQAVLLNVGGLNTTSSGLLIASWILVETNVPVT